MLWLVVGVLLINLTLLDALWTTLRVDGHAGPLTTRHTSWTRRIIWRLARRNNHRLLSLRGPVVPVSGVLLGTLLLWAGWIALFSADPLSLLHTRHGTPATLADRVYFTGHTVFTLGNVDFSPQEAWWQMCAAAASLSGLFLVTLAVTYLLSVLEAVVRKRSFASQVMALGSSAAPRSSTRPTRCSTSTTCSGKRSPSPWVSRSYDALLLLTHGVREEFRPAPAAIHCTLESVRLFPDTAKNAYIQPSEDPAPAPDLKRVRATGIPTV